MTKNGDETPWPAMFSNCKAVRSGGHGFNVVPGTVLDGCEAIDSGGDGFHVRLPGDVAAQVAEAVQRGSSGKTIWERFGPPLEAVGVRAEMLVSLAANSSALYVLLKEYGVPLP